MMGACLRKDGWKVMAKEERKGEVSDKICSGEWKTKILVK